MFVGRTVELGRLSRALDDASATRVVLIAGEPGIGKTHLAREFARRAENLGARVATGRAYEMGGTPPLWPWGQALRRLGATEHRGLEDQGPPEELFSPLDPSLPARIGGSGDRPTEPNEIRFELFDSVARGLADASAARPLVILLEDIHWADKSTVQLLEYLALDDSTARLLVVATYRDPPERGDWFGRSLDAIARLPVTDVMNLPPLSETDVSSYVLATYGIELDPIIVGTLKDATGGNPFLLEELTALMSERGSLESGELALPEGVRSATRSRMAALPSECVELLYWAAVVAREFDAALLGRLTGRNATKVMDDLEPARSAGLLEEADLPGYLRFRHALIENALLSELPAQRRAMMNGEVGHALEEQSAEGSTEIAARLARHFAEGSQVTSRWIDRAVQYSQLAAEQARAQGAWNEAASLYGECAEALMRSGSDATTAAQMLMEQGYCYREEARHEQAMRALKRAIDLFRKAGDHFGVGRATQIAALLPMPPGEAERMVTEALALGGHQPEREAWLRTRRQAPGDLDRADEIAERLDNDALRAEVLVVRAERTTAAGRLAESAGLHRRAREAWAGVGWTHLEARSLVHLGWVLRDAGALDEAEQACAEGLALARLERERGIENLALTAMADISVLRWDLDRAAASISQRRDLSPRTFPSLLSFLVGEHRRALDTLPPSSDSDALGTSASRHALAAQIALALGDPGRASQEFDQWREQVAPFIGTHPPTGVRVRDVLRAKVAGDQALVRLGSDSLVGRIYEALPSEEFRCVRYVALDQLRGNLALRLRRTDEAEQHFSRGIEWSETAGSPVESLRCRQGLAEVELERGQQARARRRLERVHGELLALGARLYADRVGQILSEVKSGSRAQASERPAGLTARQTEILRLVAAGMTNAEIAEELVISLNTVSNHMTNIFNRLGVSSRHQASRFAIDHGLVD